MRFRILAAVVYSVVLSSLAIGATFIVPPDRDMIATANGIATGTVLDKSCQYTASGRIETLVRIELDERIKGDFGQRNVVAIHVPGGRVGDNFALIPGAPNYQPGEHVLVFLLRTPAHEWATLNLTLGKFKFARDITGEHIVIRDGEEIVGWDVNGSPYKEKTRSAEKFTRFVREVARGGDGTEDYFVPSRPVEIAMDAKSNVTPNSFSAISYTMDFGGGASARWSSFGAGIPWVNQNTQPNAPNGGIDAITTSLAKWTNDCPTVINYIYVGADATATGGVSGAPDGRNGFIWERDLTAIGVANMPASCVGVIAVGGVSSAGSPVQTFDGSSFYTTNEVDVDGNKGLSQCTAFLASGNFTSGIVHEVGHTLSLRHSDLTRDNSATCAAPLDCSTGAIMNHIIVNGLSGVLQTWDLNAIAVLYPGGSCGTPAPTITLLNPTHGTAAGGTAVVVTGTNFLAGATVTFGGAVATGLTIGSTSISLITPAHATGTVDVTVTNPGGLFATKVGGFTFDAPSNARGNVNGSGAIDGADVFYLANFLFAGGPAPIASGDVNNDGVTNISDLFYLINYVFGGGAAPPA